jgi:hypothetical protein
LQSFIWFQISQSENHPGIIYLGFWAVTFLSFIILFFANKYIKRTSTARIGLLITIFIVALIGPLWMLSLIHSGDPQSGIGIVAEPFLALILCTITTAVTIGMNSQAKKYHIHHK